MRQQDLQCSFLLLSYYESKTTNIILQLTVKMIVQNTYVLVYCHAWDDYFSKQ